MNFEKATRTVIISLLLCTSTGLAKEPTAKALDVLDPQRITKTVGIFVVERTENTDKSLTLMYRWYDRRLDRDLERSVIVNEDTVIGIGGELKTLSDLTEEVLRAPSVATVGDDRKTAIMLRVGRDKIRVSEDQLTPKQIEQLRSLVDPLTEASKKSLEEKVTRIVTQLELNDPDKELQLRDIIRTQRLSVIQNHNAGFAPPKDARDNLNKGLNELLTPEQVDKVKNALTQNQMIRIFTVYHQIIPQLTPEHDKVILDLLRQGREEALDLKKPRDVVAAFKPYKTQIEQYITAQGYDWKQAYRKFVNDKNESHPSAEISLCPAHLGTRVNPDTHLVLTFPSTPTIGVSGKIRVYDASNDQLVDVLDMSIPVVPPRNKTKVPYTEVPYIYIPGDWTNANTKPGTPSGTALPTRDDHQLTIIGGFTDGFHFYPIIVHDKVATITLHHNLLEYNKTYYVQIDPGVLILDDGRFQGISGKSWTFTTKNSPPPADSTWLVVSGDGSGDFNTVQGAIDFLPHYNPERVTIFIKNGRYEEIVYFRQKSNITILGEDRDKVKVCYRNNEILNPHPVNIATNHYPGTFPSRRAAFTVDACSGIHLVNFTIESINPDPAQAEGLLLVGERHIVSHVTNIGSGDSLQVNGSAYFVDSSNTGWGHNILGRGPAFFNRCDHISTFGPHMLVRNTRHNHGYVCLNCKFWTTGDFDTTFSQARASPTEHAYVEAVLLNCALEDIRPNGWDTAGDDTADIHYWEYNSTNLKDGTPADVSQRNPVSRQLTMENDAEIIANYSNPAYVLGGWEPQMAPIILTQPEPTTVSPGQTASITVKVAAIPDASYQWFKDGKAIAGATEMTLQTDQEGTYTVKVQNDAGTVTSQAVSLTVCHTTESVEPTTLRKEKSISPNAVTRLGGFMQTRLEANRQGHLHSFNIDKYTAMFEEKTHQSWWWPGEQAGKWLEAAILTCEQSSDQSLRQQARAILARLVASQEPSGYLGITDPALRTDQHPLRGMDAYELYFMLHALLTAHEYWQDDAALATARGLGDYFVKSIGPGKAEFWPKDKNETIAGHRVHACLEGTLLIDPMLRLYQATGDQRYLQWSQWVVANIDRWSGYNTFSKLDRVAQGKMGVHELLSGYGIHAHTLHMNLLGLLRLYQITGDESLLHKAQGAWRDIAEHHAYITGGVSSDEGYRATQQPPLTGKEVETCSTMSWIQLSQTLLELTADCTYADMIERALWNHLFAAQAIDGESFRYFTPLNGTKPAGYFPDLSPNCCTASGPRILSMLPGLIYAQGEQDLYVNQFVDSTVNVDLDTDNKVILEQTTDYPSNGIVSFQIDTQRPIAFTLHIRLPSWCPNPTLTINGQAASNLRPGTYAQLKRQWQAGDRITLTLPMQPRWVKRTRQGDDEDLWALTRGPLVYAVDTVRWNAAMTKALGEAPKDLSRAVRWVPGDSDLNTATTPSGTLGPVYQVTLALPHDELARVMMLPFANVGQWYADAAHKPDRKGEKYRYAVWLHKAADH